jgi:hypothetical protein
VFILRLILHNRVSPDLHHKYPMTQCRQVVLHTLQHAKICTIWWENQQNYHQLIPHLVSINEENIYHQTYSGNNNHSQVTQRFTWKPSSRWGVKTMGPTGPLQLPLLATMGIIESSLEPLEDYNSINTLIKLQTWPQLQYSQPGWRDIVAASRDDTDHVPFGNQLVTHSSPVQEIW